MPQAETIHSEATKEEGVEESGDEIVAGVLYARFVPSQKSPWACTLYAIQGLAEDLCVADIAIRLATKLKASIAQVFSCTRVSTMIHRRVTFNELLRQVVAEDERRVGPLVAPRAGGRL